VDVDQFDPDYQPGKGFLYFGRLDETKGLETLIRACARANVLLKVAGRGPLESAAKALAQSLGHPVEFLGFQQGSALHQHIREARAVVLPAQWYENAPISILEAMALGKPVIGSDIGGIPEMVRHDENGWLFPPMDEAALAQTLRQVAGMPDQVLTTAGQSSRRHVSEYFSQAGYASSIQKLYDSVQTSRTMN